MKASLCFASLAAFCLAMLIAPTVTAKVYDFAKGNPELQSAGPIAFAPDSILIVGDSKAAAVVALETGDDVAAKEKASISVAGINSKIAGKMGVDAGEVAVNDMAVNPLTGNVFLSLSVAGKPAIVKVDSKEQLTPLALDSIPFSKATLANAPEDKVIERRGRKRNPRDESITDIAFVNGEILVSGRSSAEAPSTVIALAFPPEASDKGTSLEIYHGAHGRSETTAIIRTFVAMDIGGKPHVLAGFTCTPLVKFPVEQLTSNDLVKGTTVAELGNRNMPYDMVTYEQEGKTFLLIANSARGVMKVSTNDIERSEGLTERVSGTAGQEYETIESLAGTKQLDKLDTKRAVVMIESEGSLDLKTVKLP